MRKPLLCLIAIAITIGMLLAGCVTSTLAPTVIPTEGAAAPTDTSQRPAEVPTMTPTRTTTRTAIPTAEATNTPIPPSPAPLPPGTASFYRLRIDYSTTSDWTDLELQNRPSILTSRQMSVSGDATYVETRVYHLALGQPLSAAEAGQRVGVTVDYALAPEALGEPLEFLLQKGAIGGSRVRVFNVVGDDLQLIQEVNHDIVVESDPGLNPLAFSVDLDTLRVTPPLEVQIPRLASQKMLWAFYYPWYSMDDWSSPILKDRPETRYRSDDRAAIARHVEQAQSAGIDGFISSWWGPGDYTDQNLRLLLDIAQERGFSVTVYFETLAEEGPRDREEILRWLAYLISTYRDHPAFMKVNGKPLVAIWASGTVPLATWESVFSDLRAQGLDAIFLAGNYDLANLEVFDGLHEYGIFNIPNLAETLISTGKATRYYTLLSDTSTAKIWVATVQPGYDDRLSPGREGLFQDRRDGEFYRQSFQAALQSDPDWIFITTWNEWWEHTHIEPSEQFGDQYLQITQEFSDLWKGQ